MGKRVHLIDALRGFSLLGILLANMLVFQYGMVGKDYIEHRNLIDSASYYFTKIFVETSFMPIFALIFGYSFIKLFESIKERQHKSRWPLIRRAIGLMVLGFIHSRFIWEGDILLFYGGTLFILLFFLYRKPKTIFIWAGVFFGLTMLLTVGPNMELYDEDKVVPYVIEENKVFSSGTYAEIYDYRLNTVPPIDIEGISAEVIMVMALLLAPIMYLPLFLLGMGLAKLNYFATPSEEKPFYKKLIIIGVLGLVLKAIGQTDINFSDYLYTLGGPLLTLGYIGLFAFLYAGTYQSTLDKWFTPVGKLSLTNYLMQSIIFTLIFYGYGFGLFGGLGTTLGIILSIAVFGLQIVASQLYLRHFNRGPFEAILRMWTNLKWK